MKILDLKTKYTPEDWEGFKESATELGITFAELNILTIIHLRDLSDKQAFGSFMSHASAVVEAIADDRLDEDVPRAFRKQENIINKLIAKKLGLNSRGLKEYKLSKSSVRGKSVAILASALSPLMM